MKPWQEKLFNELKIKIDRGTISNELILARAMEEGFFIETYADLTALAETDMKKALSIVKSLVGKTDNKVISKRRLMHALKVTLHNTDMRNTKPLLDKTYISSLMYKKYPCIATLSKYGKYMSNPVAFFFDDDWRMHKSLVIARGQEIPGAVTGRRIRYQYIDKIIIPSIHINHVSIELVHPLIWYLLEEGSLIDYAILYKIPITQYAHSFTQGTDKETKSNGGDDGGDVQIKESVNNIPGDMN